MVAVHNLGCGGAGDGLEWGSLGNMTPEQLRDQDPRELSGRERLLAAQDISRMIASLDGKLAILTSGAIEEAKDDPALLHLTGARNPIDMMQTVTGSSRKRIGELLRLGEVMRAEETLPVLTEAMEKGDLPLESANLIVSLIAGVPDAEPQTRDQVERSLVDSATGNEGPRFNANSMQNETRRLRRVLDPGVVARNEKWAIQNRSIRLTNTKDGLISINGRLMPEVAGLVENLLGACVTKDKGKVIRTPDQKRHDAFATILNGAAASKKLPNSGGAPITVMIQVDDLANAQLDPATPLTDAAVQHAACAGSLQKLVLEEPGKIVALGSSQRVFTAHQRKAIHMRDGGCVIPGCDIPPGWCEIHHVTPHRHGGPTHTDNGVMLCWYHHRHIDTSGWEIVMENGVPNVTLHPWTG